MIFCAASGLNTTTPFNAIGWDPTLPAWPYDPDKAKSLPEDAGYGDGFKLMVESAAGQDLARIDLVRLLPAAYDEDPPLLYLHDTVMFDGLNKRVRGYAPVNLTLITMI